MLNKDEDSGLTQKRPNIQDLLNTLSKEEVQRSKEQPDYNKGIAEQGKPHINEWIEARKSPKEEPKTALRYNKDKLKWHLVDYKALEPLVKVLMYGAKRYTTTGPQGEVISGDNNWKLGLSKKEILDSIQRHLAALMSGELVDPESNESHIGHIFCNALFYSYFTTVDSSNARD